MRRALLWAALFCLPLAADTLVVGDNGGPANANAFPFGTAGGISAGYYDPTATFQQLYSASDFSGPITITGISFASASGVGGTPGVFSDILSLGLGTAATPVTAPDPTYSNNQSADFTNVFSGPVTASLSETDTFDLSFTFTTPFTYNPANGDLLFQVTIGTPVTYTGTYLYFDADNVADESEVFNPSPSTDGNVYPGYGLFTEFTYNTQSSTAPTPEPATSALLFAGAAALFTVRTRTKS